MTTNTPLSKRFKFTDKSIRALPNNLTHSNSTDLEPSDTQVIGSKCLVGKTGNKRFLFRYTYRGKKQSISLGSINDINVSTASKIAQKHRVSLSEGTNPKAERDNNYRLSVDDFFKQHYLPHIKKRKKTWSDDKYRYEVMVSPSLGNILYRDLSVLAVQRLHFKLSETVNKYGNVYAPATCNQA